MLNGASSRTGVQVLSVQNVHFEDTDLCALTLFSCFRSSAFSQTDTDQSYNTQ